MKLSMQLVTAMLVFCACSKNSDGGGGTNPPATKTKNQLLTQKEWVMKSWQYRADSNPNWIDNFSGKAACVQDDHFVFKTDGIWQQTDGATKCNPNDPFILVTSSWSLLQGDTQLKIGTTTYTIDALDEQTLSVSYDYYVLGTLNHSKETYSH